MQDTTIKPKPIGGWRNLPETGLVVITGFRGSGKSGLAWKLAEDAHDRKRPVAAYDFTPAAKTASTVKEMTRWAPRHDERIQLR